MCPSISRLRNRVLPRNLSQDQGNGFIGEEKRTQKNRQTTVAGWPAVAGLPGPM